MASVQDASTEKNPKNSSSFEVITLSSDEEDSTKSKDNVSFLFSRFILACRPHVTKEAIKDARQIFKEYGGNLTTRSENLADMLARYGSEIRQANAGMYLHLICKELNKDKSGKNSVMLNSVDDIINDKVESAKYDCDVISARNFEQIPKQSTNENVEKTPSKKLLDISTISIDDDDDFVSKKPGENLTERNTASTSSVHQDTNVNKAKGKISTKNLSKKQKKHLVARLRQRLKEISNEIKILNRAELTLEEMEMSDSTYIKEHRLKKNFEKVWNKLCKILGRPPNTGRVTEKPVRASSTGYSMIDKAIAKFLKEKQGSFPDFFDIRDVVLSTNRKHDLRMSPQVLNGIIADIFTDIGNKLQRRRERDLLFNFGSHLLDDFKTEEDPALSSENLAIQLEKNRRISKKNLKKVYAKYTHLERCEIDDRTRGPGSSRMRGTYEDIRGESGTSNDEEDQRSRYDKYPRLNQCEVEGKSKKNSSRPGSSRAVHEDISSESSTSEDEQDLSKTENDDSSQEYSMVRVRMNPVTDISLSSSNVEPSLSDSERTASPIFLLSCPVTRKDGTSEPKQTMPTIALEQDLSNNNTRRNQTLSASSDCEIINNSKDDVKQLDVSGKEPVSQVEPVSNVKQPTTDDDCLIIDNNQKEPLSTSKPMNDNPEDKVKQHDVPPKEPSGCELDHPTTDDDCLIIDNDEEEPTTNQKEMLTTSEPMDNNPEDKIKQHNVPGKEPLGGEDSEVEQPTTDDDCLIIHNDQEPPNSLSHEMLTSTSTDDLTLKLNALRSVFQLKCDAVDKSKLSASSSDEPANLVVQVLPDASCSSKVGTIKDNIEDLNVKCSKVVSDSDVVTSDCEQCLTVGSDQDVDMSDHGQCLTVVSDADMSDHEHGLTVVSESDMSDSKHCLTVVSEADMSDSEQRLTVVLDSDSVTSDCEQPSTSNVLKYNTSRSTNSSSPSPKAETNPTSILCHSSPKPDENIVNPRKRKATTELTVNIPKSTVKCLEKIAQALKNKKLKLPEAWINPKKAENIVSSATTSKEFSPVTRSPSENNSPTLPLVNGKAKINFQQRQVFREKTLNALKAPTKPVIENGTVQPIDVTSRKTISNISLPASDVIEGCEVIIIDD